MPTNTETELVEMEKRYWRALKDRDAEAAVRLTDFPCVVVGAQGVGSIDEKAFIGMMKSATYELQDFDLSDLQVRLLRDGVAIVAYKVHERLTVEGKPVTFDAADASTWIKRDGTWRCALHTETIAGDPYGRDRQARK